jgi:hypothetical protein
LLSEVEISELDALGERLGLASIAEAKRSPERAEAYKLMHLKRDMLEGLERCLGEVVVAMVI